LRVWSLLIWAVKNFNFRTRPAALGVGVKSGTGRSAGPDEQMIPPLTDSSPLNVHANNAANARAETIRVPLWLSNASNPPLSPVTR
jgi:hypothetical protein